MHRNNNRFNCLEETLLYFQTQTVVDIWWDLTRLPAPATLRQYDTTAMSTRNITEKSDVPLPRPPSLEKHNPPKQKDIGRTLKVGSVPPRPYYDRLPSHIRKNRAKFSANIVVAAATVVGADRIIDRVVATVQQRP